MITRAAFLLNKNKPEALKAAAECAALCEERGITPFFLEADRADVENCGFTPKTIGRPCAGNVDALFVFGGDGTVLRALDEYVAEDLPVLGINLGRLGFLLEVETRQMGEAVDCLVSGRYEVKHRMMIAYEAHTPAAVHRGFATNEVTVSRGLSQRTIAMDVSADGRLVEHYIADGVLVASPTGSTAYSLSAGGPIISPDVDCLLINPVCPHMMESRPIILPCGSEIKITLSMKERREGIRLSADGSDICELANDDHVIIRRSKHDALMIRMPHEQNFFALLKSKRSQWIL